MKQKNYKLRIDNPCEQEWTSMTKNENGKFCSHCSKSVIDFIKFSDPEIIEMINQTSSKLCGRFTNQQLDRRLFQQQLQTPNVRFHKILAGLLLIAGTKSSFATGNPSQIEIVSSIKTNKVVIKLANNNEVETSTTDSLKTFVQGKVIDGQTKSTLPSAMVMIKNTKISVQIDLEGRFKLIIPETVLSKKIILTIKYIGYETSEITIDRKDLPVKKEIPLTAAKFVMGEVVIIRNKK